MTEESTANRRAAVVWIKRSCWVAIAAFLTRTIAVLATGGPLESALNFRNPSVLTIAAAASALILVFSSPKVFRTATMIEATERKSVLFSFSFVFVLMAAYYILRPVRDAMASDWSNTEISILWNLQLVLSTLLIAGYGYVCSRVKLRHLVPSIYVFFAGTFVAFYLGSSFVENRTLLDKAFYIWVTLFSLMHLSVFWTFMADLFTKEQSRRLFAFIAAGASAGAAAGPLLAGAIVSEVGTDNLILIASAMLVIPLPIIRMLQREDRRGANERRQDDSERESVRLGGNPLAGFKYFATNPYLLTIGAFMLLYTAIGSFAYFEQVELLRDFTREERTAILSTLAATVNILTFGLGIFATSRIVTRLGMPTALALVPVFICVGLVILAFAPILSVLLALQVARQGGNYGITRPAREMLFTNVDREARFKAKPVIDVVVYRGGDATTSIVFAWLTDGIGFGVAAMAAIGAMIAALWATAGIYLGRVFARHDGDMTGAAENARGLVATEDAAN